MAHEHSARCSATAVPTAVSTVLCTSSELLTHRYMLLQLLLMLSNIERESIATAAAAALLVKSLCVKSSKHCCKCACTHALGWLCSVMAVPASQQKLCMLLIVQGTQLALFDACYACLLWKQHAISFVVATCSGSRSSSTQQQCQLQLHAAAPAATTHMCIVALCWHTECNKTNTALSIWTYTRFQNLVFGKTAAYISAQSAPEAISKHYFVLLLVNIGDLKRDCQRSTMHSMMRHTTYTTLHCGMLWCQALSCPRQRVLIAVCSSNQTHNKQQKQAHNQCKHAQCCCCGEYLHTVATKTKSLSTDTTLMSRRLPRDSQSTTPCIAASDCESDATIIQSIC
eukprot:13744-Heterococcus_DN1.PRE.1